MYDESDREFMTRALGLAARAMNDAAPNPRVGCVIVRDGRVLGEGWTQPPGSNHAEIEALLDVRRHGHDVRGATVYVSLEPCSHFGKTPPCSTALIESHVGRVIAAVEDPEPTRGGARPRDAAQCRHRRALRTARARSGGDECRVFLPDAAGPALGPHEKSRPASTARPRSKPASRSGSRPRTRAVTATPGARAPVQC